MFVWFFPGVYLSLNILQICSHNWELCGEQLWPGHSSWSQLYNEVVGGSRGGKDMVLYSGWVPWILTASCSVPRGLQVWERMFIAEVFRVWETSFFKVCSAQQFSAWSCLITDWWCGTQDWSLPRSSQMWGFYPLELVLTQTYASIWVYTRVCVHILL